MKDTRAILLLLSFSFCLFLGCASRPVELIDQTEKARQEATDAHADQFAIEDWSAAEKAWAAAEEALNAEDYGKASNELLRAKGRYAKARDIATGLKERTLMEIEGAKSPARIRLDSLKEAAAKFSARQKQELEPAIQDIEAKLAKVDEHVKNGEFNDAKFLAQKTLREVWELEQKYKK